MDSTIAFDRLRAASHAALTGGDPHATFEALGLRLEDAQQFTAAWVEELREQAAAHDAETTGLAFTLRVALGMLAVGAQYSRDLGDPPHPAP